MIIKLPKLIEFTQRDPFLVEWTPDIRSEIDRVWHDYIQKEKRDNVFNGDVYLITDYHNESNKSIIEIGKAKYSDIIYAKTTGKITTRSLFVASYITTADNYFGFVFDNGNRLNTIGGMADNEDFVNGKFIAEKCLERELREELGISIYDPTIFDSCQPKYLKSANKEQEKLSMYPIGVLYELQTVLTKDELVKLLLSYQDNVKEKNIKPVFFASSDYEKMVAYENKVSYILELFKAILDDLKPNN